MKENERKYSSPKNLLIYKRWKQECSVLESTYIYIYVDTIQFSFPLKNFSCKLISNKVTNIYSLQGIGKLK